MQRINPSCSCLQHNPCLTVGRHAPCVNGRKPETAWYFFEAVEALFGGVVSPGHGEVSGAGEDLVGFGCELAGEGVSGMIAA